MTVRRGALYTGVFLLAAGAVTLAGAANLLDPAAVANAVVVLWPLAVIAIGVGLVLRRSRAAVAAGILAAALPGLALGATAVAAPATVRAAVDDLAVPCTGGQAPSGPVATSEGSFAGAARVSLALSCGDLDVTTAPGSGWQVDARDGDGRVSRVTGTADRLDADSGGRRDRWSLAAGAVAWDVVLPTDSTVDLATELNAGRGVLSLAGAGLGDVDLEANAADLRVDLGGATVDRLDLELNAGSAAIDLPVDSFAGDLSVNAGSLALCVPDGLGLRVRSSTSLGSFDAGGLLARDGAWETPGYQTATNRADLAVEASVGSVTINPKGGCK